jgi:CBS domain-containing protein
MTTHPTILQGLVAERHRDIHASVSRHNRRLRHQARFATRAEAPSSEDGASDGESPTPRPALATVDDIVRSDAPAVAPDTPLWDVAAILAEEGISGVPVIDRRGAVVGVVSEKDLIQRQYGPPEARGWKRFGRRRHDEALRKATARTAGDAMSAITHTVSPSTSLAEAADRFSGCGADMLAVIDDSGALSGVVYRNDLLRMLAPGDRQLAADIERLLRRFWIRFEGLEIAVVRGQVRLKGLVDYKAEAQMAERATGRLPGVFAVESHLCWRREA